MKKIKLEVVVSGDDELKTLRAIQNNLTSLWYDTDSINLVVEDCDDQD